MSAQNKKLKVLWIENDARLIQKMGKVLNLRLKPLGIDLDIVKEMATASKRLENHLGAYFALIVDIMLPPDEEKRKKAEGLENRRRDLLDKASGPAIPESQVDVSSIKREIDAVDLALESLTDMEGGIRLLEEAAEKAGKIAQLTIIFTARGLLDLKDRAEKCVEAGKFYWVEKPVSSDHIISILQEHGKKQE
jgi:CheY-like chemotaxis protein